MEDEDYKTYRMIVCSGCRTTGDDVCDNWKCWASKEDIDNCIDANAPMEEPYSY